jgi:hypothetical protein
VSPAYDRLDEVGATTVHGLIAGSKVQVLHCPDGPAAGQVVLWATAEVGDDDGRGVVLLPGAVADLIEALQHGR